MSPNLHEDASSVKGKLRVNCLELRPPFPRAGIPVTTIEIFIPRDPTLLRASELSVQISMARMKSAAFLKASSNVVSFCSAKENLRRLF